MVNGIALIAIFVNLDAGAEYREAVLAKRVRILVFSDGYDQRVLIIRTICACGHHISVRVFRVEPKRNTVVNAVGILLVGILNPKLHFKIGKGETICGILIDGCVFVQVNPKSARCSS